MGNGMMSDGMMMGGMMSMMMLGTVLFWIVLVIGSVWVARLVWEQTIGERLAAVRILQERLACGEIDIEEYQERRSILQRWR